MSTYASVLQQRYQANNEILAANPELDLPLMRALMEEIHRCAAEPAGVTYAEVDAGGRQALWCTPVASSDDAPVVLFLHGGGFVLQSPHSHRKLAGHLAVGAGAPVLVLDYRQAPEHAAPAQLEDAVAAYAWLIDQGVPADRIAVAGDSAGANLAVTTVLRLRDQGAPLPAGVIGFSPWFDLECRGASMETNADKDLLITKEICAMMAGLYLGEGGSPSDPALNPLYADFSGFPPIYLCAGGDEALLDDGRRLTDLAREAGADVTFDVVPGQQHVHVFMAGRAAEADRSIATAAAWLSTRVGQPATSEISAGAAG